MKKMFTLFALVYFACSSYATVRTVSNDPNIPAQYTDFNTAYTASAAGDTIYVHGSATSYSLLGGSVNKALTIIGPGFNPDKQYRLPASFNIGITINVSNVNFFGIYDPWGITFGNNVTNCRISRCFSVGIGINSLTNLSIVIDGVCFSKTGNLSVRGFSHTIQNCILNTVTFGAGTQNCTLDHNTCMQTMDFTVLANSWISNNLLFMGVFTASLNNAFNNNQNAGPGTLPGAGNTGAANFSAPVAFVDYNSTRPFYFYNNLDMTAASLGNNAATDGTDIGAYGGGNPYAQEGEVKTLPIIREMDIMTPVVPSPGNINVHIRATQPK